MILRAVKSVNQLSLPHGNQNRKLTKNILKINE